ncbi:MAG: ABC transporter ATP-binding protein [Clostridiales bacterium]|nr:ABC transporter ATP-binding protein [Clostridiales bacterium]
MSSLKVAGLNKIYPSGATALYDINFETQDKEFIVIIGGESSGKSSLLRVIAGLEDATDGKIEIGGTDMTEVHPKDRNVAMIFRHDTLYPDLNVFENMAFGLKQRKAPAALIDQRVKAVSKILGLDEVLYRKPKALTAAAKQRVALGRAIAREPKLYLLDEPLEGFDEKLRADMLNLIINVQARMEGTFVYATKNLSEAMTIGTRIIVLKNGLIQQIDTPANLYDYPANAYVAFYIGAPTVNFIKGAKIVKEGENYIVSFNGGALNLPENIVKRFENIEDYANNGKQVWLGIRPEDCTAVKDGGVLSGTVLKVESDGDRTYAEIAADGVISMIVGGQSTLQREEKCQIEIDLTRLLIFDGDTRLTLLTRDGGYKNTGFADAEFTPMPIDDENKIVEKLKPKKEVKKKK